MTLLQLAEFGAVLLSPLAAAFGAYTAVRVRLAVLETRMKTCEDRAEHAHERIDRVMLAP